MSRDQRAHDNWALLYAQKLALERKVPLIVVFCLVPKFLEATIRQFGFMLRGLKEVEETLMEKEIPFFLLRGYAKDVLPEFVDEQGIGCLVTDMSPLRVPASWYASVAQSLEPKKVPVIQVDAHNIVPVWHASQKMEVGARTIRPKIHKYMPAFCTEYPKLKAHPHGGSVKKPKAFDLEKTIEELEVDKTVPEVKWARPGFTGGMAELNKFCKDRLKIFGADRNNPNKNALSNLSPWIHFGQISVQRAVLAVRAHCREQSGCSEGKEAFIEESVVRRELADNFCFYNDQYDKLEGCAQWAQESLQLHEKDKRYVVYSLKDLEQGKTHDDLWNASQLQMAEEGKMHGFLRMYWAKKILEWSPNPTLALEWAIYLNDRYELDGRDPNGYVGCMWSIGGIHDQGWGEREVFGKIRYMNYDGCKKKFDVPAFIRRYANAAKNARAVVQSKGSLPMTLKMAKK
uniref:Deoxyribodipyrimidine photo-lyase n=1 Tax=Chromera velia CCMP2878 TaxID=1169474 RepID=A0A0G4FHS6_9ALVE|eukprot:Cvel_17073.t1-p1 / transcript=Cvel_17073.t1 / gene=Cvel_17073 / organism=Chromera_velia_CCMP2878 / gene_product=Deoxyribodipyrimidine photo-lyase, putative / transcript_product=Deoxyribodipyrimidine photo-lyase, putative / location=Cvel_scaffold1346:8784-16434(+) / protein_length=457 / sequence_SO=supercontig / SO=protein_coding / is_pseudo=false